MKTNRQRVKTREDVPDLDMTRLPVMKAAE